VSPGKPARSSGENSGGNPEAEQWSASCKWLADTMHENYAGGGAAAARP